MTEMMRAVVCTEPGKLDIVERPLPRRQAGEALVRIRRIGVCGTDMHIYQGNQPYFVYPRVMGHELAAELDRPAPSTVVTPTNGVRHSDAPICMQCGVQMQRAGSCHACPSCGSTSGCS